MTACEGTCCCSWNGKACVIRAEICTATMLYMQHGVQHDPSIRAGCGRCFMGLSWAEQVRFLPNFASHGDGPAAAAAVAVAVLPTTRPTAAAEMSVLKYPS